MNEVRSPPFVRRFDMAQLRVSKAHRSFTI
jgi:hypothetical protein